MVGERLSEAPSGEMLGLVPDEKGTRPASDGIAPTEFVGEQQIVLPVSAENDPKAEEPAENDPKVEEPAENALEVKEPAGVSSQ